MATGYERYTKHAVWETLQLKLDSLKAARFDDATSEQVRKDTFEWLQEAQKTKAARQPALYLTTLDQLSAAVNQLPVDTAQVKQFVAYRGHNGQAYQSLEQALRGLPLPPPKDLKAAYVGLLDQEVEARTLRLDELEERIKDTEKSLQQRMDELSTVSANVAKLQSEIDSQRDAIKEVSDSADADMRVAWDAALEEWKQERKATDAAHDVEALESIATLAAVTKGRRVVGGARRRRSEPRGLVRQGETRATIRPMDQIRCSSGVRIRRSRRIVHC